MSETKTSRLSGKISRFFRNHRLIYRVLFIGCAAFTCCCAAEEIPLNRISDWELTMKLTRPEEGVLRLTGRDRLISRQTFRYDPAGKYRISGSFDFLPDKENLFNIGIVPLDGNKRKLDGRHTLSIPKTDTTLTQAAKAGDSVLFVSDASGWRRNNDWCVIAYKTKTDHSDLPNKNIIAAAPVRVEKTDGGWRVELSRKIDADIPAGTGVRLHHTGGFYRWLLKPERGVAKWNTPIEIPGEPGMQYFQVVVSTTTQPLKSGSQLPVLEMRNFRLIHE